MISDMEVSRQKPMSRGVPPRVVLPPTGTILPYYKPRLGHDWLLLPDTLAVRIAAAARMVGAIVLVIALVMIAIS
jgi:hypothetical protein